jgi:hypothetical protein
MVVYNIGQVSLRQASCPDHLLGRMNATIRFVTWGAMPIGGLVGGALGAAIGARDTLILSATGMSLSFLWLILLSPPRGASKTSPSFHRG